jgi:excisionase family DNA binding protein
LSAAFGVATVCAVGSKRRFTVTEAARVLGVTESAVRGRINRGTLGAEREGGTVYVRLSDEQLSNNQQTTGDYSGEYSALTSALEARIESLERQLTAERSSSAELRRLLAAALERIPPQLEPPSEPSESPETATMDTDEGEPRPDIGEHVPWWRRMFGG